MKCSKYVHKVIQIQIYVQLDNACDVIVEVREGESERERKRERERGGRERGWQREREREKRGRKRGIEKEREKENDRDTWFTLTFYYI